MESSFREARPYGWNRRQPRRTAEFALRPFVLALSHHPPAGLVRSATKPVFQKFGVADAVRVDNFGIRIIALEKMRDPFDEAQAV